MTSPADAQRLATNEYEDKLAAGIVTGIMAYLDNNSGAAAATSPTADPAAAAAPKAN
jgi:hypothetical protein